MFLLRVSRVAAPITAELGLIFISRNNCTCFTGGLWLNSRWTCCRQMFRWPHVWSNVDSGWGACSSKSAPSASHLFLPPSQAGRARRAPRPSYPPCALSRIKWHTLTFLAVVVQPLTDRCPRMKVVAGLFKMSRDGAEGWLLNRTHLSFASRVCFRTRPGFLIINFFIDVILHSDLSGFSLLFLYE